MTRRRARKWTTSTGIVVKLDENTVDFDVKKEIEDTAKGKGISAEQVKQHAGAAG